MSLSLDVMLSPQDQTKLKKISDTLMTTSLSQLVKQAQNDLDTTVSLDTILTILAHLSRIDAPADASYRQSLSSLLETLVSILKPPYSHDDESSSRAEATLACLVIVSGSFSKKLSPDKLLHVTAFTGREEAWSTEYAATSANHLLDSHLDNEQREEFIVNTVLGKYLRAIFSNTSSKVTAAGRPVQYAQQKEERSISTEQPSWKKPGSSTVTIFQWVVQVADTYLIKQHWPLFMPVLLTLAEDPETPTRERGINILTTFIEKCPAQTLLNTGIADVFRESLFPTLLYLPNLTPVDESVQLLSAAYKALLMLAQLDEDPKSLRRRKSLDKLLRDGIFAGYHFAPEHIRVVEVLLQNTKAIVGCLDVFSVKHLQVLLNMLSSVMTDPFALGYPSAVQAAAETLNVVLSKCWPRMADASRTGEVIRVLVVCWLNVEDEEQESKQLPPAVAKGISCELQKSMKILRAIWQSQNQNPPHELLTLAQTEPKLAGLLEPK